MEVPMIYHDTCILTLYFCDNDEYKNYFNNNDYDIHSLQSDSLRINLSFSNIKALMVPGFIACRFHDNNVLAREKILSEGALEPRFFGK